MRNYLLRVVDCSYKILLILTEKAGPSLTVMTKAPKHLPSSNPDLYWGTCTFPVFIDLDLKLDSRNLLLSFEDSTDPS